jgi:hypothetical protein
LPTTSSSNFYSAPSGIHNNYTSTITTAATINSVDPEPFLVASTSSSNLAHPLVSPTTPSNEKHAFATQPSRLHSTHPRLWTVSEVAEWFYSNDVALHIIDSFSKENINGISLLNITDGDVAALLGPGGRIGDRVCIRSLINELKAEWRIPGGMGAGPAYVPGVLVERVMEAGKGAASTTDVLPPSYSP